MIQNSDGKLVHLPPPSTPDRTAPRTGLDMMAPNSLYSPADIHIAEKVEGVGREFQSMLTLSLEQQRAHLEGQMSKMELNSVDRIMYLEGVVSALEAENSRLWR